MNTIFNHKTAILPIILSAILGANQAAAEDWTISAEGSCETELGNTVYSAGGLKASGGTAVVKGPLVKEVVGSAIKNVWGRMHRASGNSPRPFCYLVSRSMWGTAPEYAYGYPVNNNAGNQSLPIVPGDDQYYGGYADAYCVLNVNDILFGIRYKQSN